VRDSIRMHRLGVILTGFGLFSSSVSLADVSTSSSIQAAIQALNRADVPQAEAAITAAINSLSFLTLDETTRHLALALAAQITLRASEPERARKFARDATEMPQNDIDDWRNRLSASIRLGDARDQAFCVTTIARRWGDDWSALPPSGTVFNVFRNSDRSELSDVELDMLEALYQRRWHPVSEAASPFWLALTRLLLDKNRRDAAAEVAIQVDNPDDIIVMHADRRFRFVVKARFVRSDAHQAALDRIKALQNSVNEHPRSLDALRGLLTAMIEVRMESKALALALAEEADLRLSASASAYDEVTEKYAEILDVRATALHVLGRNDEAVSQLRRAIALPGNRNTVNQQINLGLLLCALDRPDEALALLPQADMANAYGNALIALIRVTAGLEKGNIEYVNEALSYLRAHTADNPSVLQSALLRAGEREEARQLLLWRLNDLARRGSALREMQEYAEPSRTLRESQWHALAAALRTDPTVLTATHMIGDIYRYTWRYDSYR
jgi:hypothetical protein